MGSEVFDSGSDPLGLSTSCEKVCTLSPLSSSPFNDILHRLYPSLPTHGPHMPYSTPSCSRTTSHSHTSTHSESHSLTRSRSQKLPSITSVLTSALTTVSDPLEPKVLYINHFDKMELPTPMATPIPTTSKPQSTTMHPPPPAPLNLFISALWLPQRLSAMILTQINLGPLLAEDPAAEDQSDGGRDVPVSRLRVECPARHPQGIWGYDSQELCQPWTLPHVCITDDLKTCCHGSQPISHCCFHQFLSVHENHLHQKPHFLKLPTITPNLHIYRPHPHPIHLCTSMVCPVWFRQHPSRSPIQDCFQSNCWGGRDLRQCTRRNLVSLIYLHAVSNFNLFILLL